MKHPKPHPPRNPRKTDGASSGSVLDNRDLGAFIPSVLDDYPLTPLEFRVYARACRRAGAKGKHFEGVERLAKEFAVSVRMVRYALLLLVAAGLLRRSRRNGKTTIYRIASSKSWVPASEVPGIREKIRNGDPAKRPLHKAKDETPASGAGVRFLGPLQYVQGPPASHAAPPLHQVQPKVFPLKGLPLQTTTTVAKGRSVVDGAERPEIRIPTQLDDLHPDRLAKIRTDLEEATQEQRQRFADAVVGQVANVRRLGKWAESLARKARRGELDPDDEAEAARMRARREVEEAERRERERNEEDARIEDDPIPPELFVELMPASLSGMS